MSAAALPSVRLRPAIRTPRLPPLPNIWDGVLAQELVLWRDTMVDLRAVPCALPHFYPPDRLPWITMPKEGRAFRPVGTLAVSSVPFTGVDTPVLTTMVPVGYDGIIVEVVCELSAPTPPGTGFLEGSGDVVWRLSADGRFLRDYGNITTTSGSLRVPSAVLRRGVRIYERNVLKFTVAIQPGAPINTNAMVIVSIIGWFWPRIFRC